MHEAVFPIGAATDLPDTGSLPEDLHEMVRRAMVFLTTPAARAALPGLVGEMAADPTLHSALLERFAGIIGGGLAELLERAAARGEVRADVTAAELTEAIAGITLIGLLTRVKRTRRHLGRPHHHVAPERNHRMTHESTAAMERATGHASATCRPHTSSRATARSPTTGTLPTATACWPTTLGVAFDTYLFPEPGRPQFVAVNTPFRRDRRWGGDNTDAYYFICPSTRSGATASAATRVTACTSR